MVVVLSLILTFAMFGIVTRVTRLVGPRRRDSRRLWELDRLRLSSAASAARRLRFSRFVHFIFCSVASSVGSPLWLPSVYSDSSWSLRNSASFCSVTRRVSFESSSLTPDYTTKPPVTQVYTRRSAPTPPEPTSDEPSPAASSPEQLLRRGHRSRQPVDRYGFGPVTWQGFAGTVLSEPLSYRDAILHPEWQLAMAEEIAALERTGTWDLVPTPSHVRPITCKWVYKVKTRSDGSLERYKARLVARGFQQEHGRDYDETFAPVAHMTTVRALLAVASVREWSISQLDVKNAFLNGELREEVYMQPPPGYSVPEGMVCRLRRSLYGLKQAPRAWFQRFASVVTAAGFSASPHDPALFVHTSSRGRTLLLLYVDDMIITEDDPQFIAFVKARLSEQFLMSDLGPLRYFLGIEVSFAPEGFYLSQEKYIQGLLDRASLTDHKTEETPMELNLRLSATDGEPLDDPTRYRHIVGSLVYLGVTRPDISYSVHILSQFISAPTQLHYSHLLRVLRYLRGTMSRRLFFPRSSSLRLQAYRDATWASDSSDRRSLFAYCVFLGGSLIAWKTKKRTAYEAELRAMALVTVEVTWLRWLLADFGVSCLYRLLFWIDSTGAISIAHDPVKHELTKHIGVDAYYTRAQVQDGVVTLRYVPSELQLADFLTKAQTRDQHRFYLSKLKVILQPGVEDSPVLRFLASSSLWCKFFIWLAIKNRYWTADRLAKRGLPHPSVCPLCDQEEETIQHLLVSYVFSREVWAYFLHALGLSAIAPQSDEVEKEGSLWCLAGNAALSECASAKKIIWEVTQREAYKKPFFWPRARVWILSSPCVSSPPAGRHRPRALPRAPLPRPRSPAFAPPCAPAAPPTFLPAGASPCDSLVALLVARLLTMAAPRAAPVVPLPSVTFDGTNYWEWSTMLELPPSTTSIASWLTCGISFTPWSLFTAAIAPVVAFIGSTRMFCVSTSSYGTCAQSSSSGPRRSPWFGLRRSVFRVCFRSPLPFWLLRLPHFLQRLRQLPRFLHQLLDLQLKRALLPFSSATTARRGLTPSSSARSYLHVARVVPRVVLLLLRTSRLLPGHDLTRRLERMERLCVAPSAPTVVSSVATRDCRMGTLVGTGRWLRDPPCLRELDWLHLPSASTRCRSSSTDDATAFAATNSVSFTQWHHRLGHMCGSRLSSQESIRLVFVSFSLSKVPFLSILAMVLMLKTELLSARTVTFLRLLVRCCWPRQFLLGYGLKQSLQLFTL
ncbi:hypothetical protein U9M48_043435 [Paspalum notatum var. saurae]|uniref:Reverse transcriptase Ty1/copia-type domain-containing protein n=1 Tax=Paspalum notatum var. saurae TaxID=547442 RepID=A0AAQ3UTH3_PASNO